MKPLSTALFFLCAVSAHCPTWAAVIQRDWKTPGDGLLTFDTVNSREWLDLSQTILSSQFPGSDPSPQVTRELRYQFVVGQTGVGGLFEGFTAATSPDVRALAQSAGIDTSSQHFPTNSTATLMLSELLGYTIPPNDSSRITIGLIDEIEVRSPNPDIRIDATFMTVFSSQSGLQIGTNHFQFSPPPGVMLYRHAVPEPGTSLMLFAGVCTVGFSLLLRRFSYR